MKKLVLVLTLLVAVSFAANFNSLSNSTSLSNGVAPLSSTNAHWQLTAANEVGCVKDGDTVYGSNDDADMTYDGTTIDLTSYDAAVIYLRYGQATADANDYCTLELNAGVGDHQFVDAPASTLVIIELPVTISNLTINFNWVSDATGFDSGFEMSYFSVYGVNDGDGTYTNVLTWNDDQRLTHESEDVTGMNARGLACLSYRFTTNDAGGPYQGWAIDNVVLDADGTEYINKNFEGTPNWNQDLNGYSFGWESDNDNDLGVGGYPFPGSGYAWICDPSDNDADCNAETFSPWVSVFGATAVTLDFDSRFETYMGKEDGFVGFYSTDGTGIFDEHWTNLDDWTTSDSGTSIEETTWGQIKSM